ncbi:hypothetical protein [Pseudoxanthomonas sp. UTMC 1351]|uniref:hypothetical protein n=1 Tax=Pseudoxanthomonas sp. UTMC 1351 TaxID=2695853 RepID=UPI0034CF8B7E
MLIILAAAALTVSPTGNMSLQFKTYLNRGDLRQTALGRYDCLLNDAGIIGLSGIFSFDSPAQACSG